MDEDIRFAIQVQANEHGIFDDELIDRLVDEFQNNNYDNTGDIIDNTFDMTQHNLNGDDIIEYTFNTASHRSNMDDLQSYHNINQYEQINDRQQRQLRAQLYPNNRTTVLAPNNIGGLFQQLLGQLGSMTVTAPNIPSMFSNLNNLMNEELMTPVRVTMTQESLDKLSNLTYNQIKVKLPNLDEDEKCAICWAKLSEQIEDLKYYKILPCNHVFHSECISIELSNYSYLCPTCKTECGEHEAKIDN